MSGGRQRVRAQRTRAMGIRGLAGPHRGMLYREMKRLLACGGTLVAAEAADAVVLASTHMPADLIQVFISPLSLRSPRVCMYVCSCVYVFHVHMDIYE